MPKYINTDQTDEVIETELGVYDTTELKEMLKYFPAADVEPVRHAHWELSATHYFDEDGNCTVYVTGVCSSCKTKWHRNACFCWDKLPNYDYDNERDYPITKDRIDKCKEDYLQLSKKRILEISPFCEKCGAKMDEEEN